MGNNINEPLGHSYEFSVGRSSFHSGGEKFEAARLHCCKAGSTHNLVPRTSPLVSAGPEAKGEVLGTRLEAL